MTDKVSYPITEQENRILLVALSNYKEQCHFINKTSIHERCFGKMYIHQINVLYEKLKQLDAYLEYDKTYVCDVVELYTNT